MILATKYLLFVSDADHPWTMRWPQFPLAELNTPGIDS